MLEEDEEDKKLMQVYTQLCRSTLISRRPYLIVIHLK